METASRLLFVSLVTCYLLGRILAGAASPAEVVVYGMTAAFGLEYMAASWGGIWRRGSAPLAPRGRAVNWGPVDVRRTDVLKASPRMFDSDLLDRLSRVHPAVPPVIFLPAVAILFVIGARQSTTLGTLGLVAGGWLFWTLTEYWIHRAVFHFEPEWGPGARFHWIIHGVHHDHPNDPLRLVMPPSVSVPLAALFVAGFILVLGEASGTVFASGFLLGYLVYDMTHYYLHHFRPRSRFGKLMRELHMRHHFQDDTRGFGISAPFWDYVFGTPLKRR